MKKLKPCPVCGNHPYDGHKKGCSKTMDAIADVVLNYRPKSKQPKPRKRKKAKRVKRG